MAYPPKRSRAITEHDTLDFRGPEPSSVKRRRQLNQSSAAFSTDDPLAGHENLPNIDEKEKWRRYKICAQGKFTSAITAVKVSVNRHAKTVEVILGGSTKVEFLQYQFNDKLALKKGDRQLELLSQKQYSKFKNIVRAIALRPTPRLTDRNSTSAPCDLAAASDDSGLIHIFDADTRTQLRRLRGHSGPVYSLRFLTAKNLISGGEDTSLRIWDISDGSCVAERSSAHGDSIKVVAASVYNRSVPSDSSEPTSFSSGSLDGKIKLWVWRRPKGEDSDEESIKLVESFDHESAVESLVYFGSHLLASGGGTSIRIWDLMGGAHLLHTLSNHSKAITSLSTLVTGNYLMSGSIDRTLKVYSLSDFNNLHTFSFEEPITNCEGFRLGNEAFLVTFGDGAWQIRVKVPSKKPKKSHSKTPPKANTPAFYKRGPEAEPRPTDIVLETDAMSKPFFSSVDHLLRAFKFSASLDEAVKKGSPEMVVALIEALIDEGTLPLAFQGRSEETVIPLLRFVAKQLRKDPSELPIFSEFTSALLREAPWLWSTTNPEVVETLETLQQQMNDEVAQQEILDELRGVVELIWSGSTYHKDCST